MHRFPRLRPLVPLLAAFAVALALAAPVGAATIAPPDEQLLRVNVGAMPSSLDPGRARFLEDRIVANAIFAPLYRSAGGSGGRLVPWLAQGQPVVSRAGRRVTVRLRAAKWSDGRPVTAGDVVFAFNRARSASPFGTDFAAVRRAVAMGQRTVRFELSSPVPWFGELLASTVTTPVPAHVVRKYAARWTNLDKLVTSGPFEPVTGRGRTELMLRRSATFWAARRVRLQRLELRAVTAASASPLFRANRLDVGLRGTSIHPSSIATWARDPRFRSSPTGAAQYLFANARDPRLADARVRRAIALAIDRDAIVELTAKGADVPLASIVPDGIRGQATVVPAGSSLLAATGGARTAEATALLQQAGWANTAPLQLAYPADGGTAASVAAAIGDSLARAGVAVTLRGYSTTQFARRGVGVAPVGDDVDLVLAGWSPDWSDPASFHQLFTCASIEAGLNLANWCDPAYDEAWHEAVAATGTARLAVHARLERLLAGPEGAFPAIPLYAPVGTMLVQPWVRGFAQAPSGMVDFDAAYVVRH
jgi:oligopeptide transport system substrate-binding protein